jgi:hypothetical protein
LAELLMSPLRDCVLELLDLQAFGQPYLSGRNRRVEPRNTPNPKLVDRTDDVAACEIGGITAGGFYCASASRDVGRA